MFIEMNRWFIHHPCAVGDKTFTGDECDEWATAVWYSQHVRAVWTLVQRHSTVTWRFPPVFNQSQVLLCSTCRGASLSSFDFVSVNKRQSTFLFLSLSFPPAATGKLCPITAQQGSVWSTQPGGRSVPSKHPVVSTWSPVRALWPPR